MPVRTYVFSYEWTANAFGSKNVAIPGSVKEKGDNEKGEMTEHNKNTYLYNSKELRV